MGKIDIPVNFNPLSPHNFNLDSIYKKKEKKNPVLTCVVSLSNPENNVGFILSMQYKNFFPDVQVINSVFPCCKTKMNLIY